MQSAIATSIAIPLSPHIPIHELLGHLKDEYRMNELLYLSAWKFFMKQATYYQTLEILEDGTSGLVMAETVFGKIMLFRKWYVIEGKLREDAIVGGNRLVQRIGKSIIEKTHPNWLIQKLGYPSLYTQQGLITDHDHGRRKLIWTGLQDTDMQQTKPNRVNNGVHNETTILQTP